MNKDMSNNVNKITKYVGRDTVGTEIREKKGRCVIALRNFSKGEVIFQDPIAEIEAELVTEDSIFFPYPMAWDETNDCVAFGLTNLLNHSDDSNVSIDRDHENKMVTVSAKRDIGLGEELTVNYECEIWFDLDKEVLS